MLPQDTSNEYPEWRKIFTWSSQTHSYLELCFIFLKQFISQHFMPTSILFTLSIRTANSVELDQMPQSALFVLRFYGPVNPMGSYRAQSVYQTTRLLGRLSPLKRLTNIVHILSPETDNCLFWNSGRERMTIENIWRSISTKECCRPRHGLNPRPPGLQSDGASNWATEAGSPTVCSIWSTSILFASHIAVFRQHQQVLNFTCSNFNPL